LLVAPIGSGDWAEWHGPEQMLVTRNGRLVQTAGNTDKGDCGSAHAMTTPFLGDLRAPEMAGN